MTKEEFAKQRWNMGLNPDGSERHDPTPLSVPIRGFGLSADQKLKQMLQRELERDREAEETNLDDFDFTLPDDIPAYHPSVLENPVPASQFKEIVREQRKQSKQTKQTGGDESPAARKSAKSDPAAKPVAKHNNQPSSAGESPDEVADDE